MRTSYDPSDCRLDLAFDSEAEATGFTDGVVRDLGFLVRLAEDLPLHHLVTVVLSTDSTSGEISARVAQVFDQGAGEYSTAFLVEDPAAAARLLSGSTTHPEPAVADDADTANPDGGEMRGTSPMHRIQQMNPKQRSLLALKAGRTERRILLRDKTPLVLQNLLTNPHIDAEEVLQIARSSHVVAPLLQRIAGDARWSSNQEIVTAVARHPRTPSVVAARLLPSLRTGDLRNMAKMTTGLKEPLRKAALREYMRRTGQRI